MAAFQFNIPSNMQTAIPRAKTLIDANAVNDSFSFDNAASSQDAITASTTQSQAGGVPITAAYSTISVATNNDAITLPQATPGRALTIVNNGGATIQIFPFVGDKVGANSANAAVTMVTARSLSLVCTVKGVWWGGLTTVL